MSKPEALAYLDDVSEMVNAELHNGYQLLKEDIQKLINKNGLKGITTKEFNDACEALLRRLEYNFERNIDKFKAYCIRNIFISDAHLVEPDEPRFNSQHKQTLRTMQHRYSLLSAEYNQLSVECRDRDLILKDMRNALFTLRLGAQAFESYDLNPVSTTMEHMSETHAKLEALCRETQVILNKIDAASYSAHSHDETGRASALEEVKAGSVADLNLLTSSIIG